MPSTVWCARKAYVVRQSPSEVQDLMLKHQVFWLDLLVDRRPPTTGAAPVEQVMVNRDHVSAVEHYSHTDQLRAAMSSGIGTVYATTMNSGATHY